MGEGAAAMRTLILLALVGVALSTQGGDEVSMLHDSEIDAEPAVASHRDLPHASPKVKAMFREWAGLGESADPDKEGKSEKAEEKEESADAEKKEEEPAEAKADAAPKEEKKEEAVAERKPGEMDERMAVCDFRHKIHHSFKCGATKAEDKEVQDKEVKSIDDEEKELGEALAAKESLLAAMGLDSTVTPEEICSIRQKIGEKYSCSSNFSENPAEVAAQEKIKADAKAKVEEAAAKVAAQKAKADADAKQAKADADAKIEKAKLEAQAAAGKAITDKAAADKKAEADKKVAAEAARVKALVAKADADAKIEKEKAEKAAADAAAEAQKKALLWDKKQKPKPQPSWPRKQKRRKPTLRLRMLRKKKRKL